MARSIINTTTRGVEAKQSIATPWAFIHALEQRFGAPVGFDLAASRANAKADRYFSKEDDALKRDWSRLPGGRIARLAYVNPPYAHIKPWARKLVDCRWLSRWTVMLVPSSLSADWFLEARHNVQIDSIPRIQFEGATHLYPKDLCVLVAGYGVSGNGYWDWRASYAQWCRERARQLEPTHMKGLTKFPAADVLPDLTWTPSPFGTHP